MCQLTMILKKTGTQSDQFCSLGFSKTKNWSLEQQIVVKIEEYDKMSGLIVTNVSIAYNPRFSSVKKLFLLTFLM